MDGLTIGEVAKRACVHIETHRYYERYRLVAKPLELPAVSSRCRAAQKRPNDTHQRSLFSRPASPEVAVSQGVGR
jgi:hypothetical protein